MGKWEIIFIGETEKWYPLYISALWLSLKLVFVFPILCDTLLYIHSISKEGRAVFYWLQTG